MGVAWIHGLLNIGIAQMQSGEGCCLSKKNELYGNNPD
jgi:hypothetical protein